MSQGYTMIPTFKHAFTYHHYGHTLEIPPPLSSSQIINAGCPVQFKARLHRSSASEKREKKIGGRLSFLFF